MSELREVESLPTEVYEPELLSAVIAVRCDRSTRGQAKAVFARDWDLPFTEVRTCKVYFDHDREYAAEMAADGIPEPYDGWPLRASEPGEGAAYWVFADWMDRA